MGGKYLEKGLEKYKDYKTSKASTNVDAKVLDDQYAGQRQAIENEVDAFESMGVPRQADTRPDFYVRPDGEMIPGTGYRATGGEVNIEELKTGEIAPRNPTYITFDNINDKSRDEVKNLLQLPHEPSHVVEFDTKQILDDIRIPDGKWDTNGVPEPITNTFGKWGKGGGTQAVTNTPIIIENNSVTPLRK